MSTPPAKPQLVRKSKVAVNRIFDPCLVTKRIDTSELKKRLSL